jgi:hypothetical protein
MPPLSDYPLASLKVLLIGPSGAGKTVLASSLGPHATYLDLDNGMASARFMQDAHTAARQQLDVHACWSAGPKTEIGRPDHVWNRLIEEVQSFRTKPQREALVIDSLTDVTSAALGAVQVGSSKWADNTAAPDTKKAFAQATSPGEWGLAIHHVEKLIYGLKITPAPIIVTAHSMLVTIQDDPVIQREVLSVYGQKLPGNLLKQFDEVWYLKVRGAGATREVVVQTQPTFLVECCKTRRQLKDGQKASLGMLALLKQIGWEPKGVTT